MKKLIIINGVMGVGKTTVSKALNKRLKNSFWLDGDNVWKMNPFVVDEENKKMVLENIGFVLNSFIKNSHSEYIIFNWVIYNDEIMKEVLKRIEKENLKIYKITLMCSKEELIKRIKKDIESELRDEGNIERSLNRFKGYEKMDTFKVDTTNRGIVEILDKIMEIII
ncbi:MAG: AAA family ATPase [Clostridium sp.]|uniref:AAA family ATPase n=1 Tax=Clostridium sp. TaxID=1506 RepID=UPI003F3DA629